MSDRKHIVLTVTNDLTYDRRMYRICTALVDAGFNVTLTGRLLKTSAAFTPGHFQTHRIRCFFNKGFLFYKEYNIRLFFYLLRLRFDIACACDLDTALPVIMSSKLRGKKTVYDAHEYFSEVPELTHRPIIKAVWQWIGRMTIPRFDTRYTVGAELANLMGKVYGVAFDVIRNIAPVDPFSDQKADDHIHREKVILYQGALNVGRGLEACINAMRQLADWTFWLAGEGDITEQLKQQVRDQGLEERVRFLGWVHPDKLPDLMAQARISINLRERESLNDYYSLPNKFFDAIHAHLPSIHMAYPEYQHIVSKYPCAVLIDEVNVDAIVRAVQFLDEHPQVYFGLVQGCQLASAEFTWENESQRLIQIYQTL